MNGGARLLLEMGKLKGLGAAGEGGRSKAGICSYLKRKITRCMWFGKHGEATRDGRIHE